MPKDKICPLLTLGRMVATENTGLYDSQKAPGGAMYCEQEKCQLWWLCKGPSRDEKAALAAVVSQWAGR